MSREWNITFGPCAASGVHMVHILFLSSSPRVFLTACGGFAWRVAMRNMWNKGIFSYIWSCACMMTEVDFVTSRRGISRIATVE